MVKYQTALLTSFTSEEITWLCMYTRSNFCVFIFTNPVNSRNLLYSIFMVFKNTKLEIEHYESATTLVETSYFDVQLVSHDSTVFNCSHLWGA